MLEMPSTCHVVLNVIPQNGIDQDGLMFSIKSEHREVLFFHGVNNFFPLVFFFFFNSSFTCSAQKQHS